MFAFRKLCPLLLLLLRGRSLQRLRHAIVIIVTVAETRGERLQCGTSGQDVDHMKQNDAAARGALATVFAGRGAQNAHCMIKRRTAI